MKGKKKSRRQKLADAVLSGNFRYWLQGKVDEETVDLAVDVLARYCEPRKKTRL